MKTKIHCFSLSFPNNYPLCKPKITIILSVNPKYPQSLCEPKISTVHRTDMISFTTISY